METRRQDVPQGDQAFLDLLLDVAVERFTEREHPTFDDWLGERPELRTEIEEVIELARSIAVRRPRSTPALPGFEIVRVLGSGASGCVYLARQLSLASRLVAVKVLSPAAALSPSSRERFQREAHILARIRDPHVVAIHDVLATGDLLAFAMEWIEGRSLSQLIEHLRERGAPPLLPAVGQFLAAPPALPFHGSYTAFVCRLGIDVARALAVVHGEGLLHRDVKPSNILLRRDGTAVLSDFGIAREEGALLHTRTGVFVGTPSYAPPEQIRGDGDVDVRADVYALGVTLYHALALELPFRGKSTTEILRSIEHGATRSLRRRAPWVSRDLETVVMKAIDPDPARRYATADLLADDLERVLELRPVLARPAGLVTRAVKLVRRNRSAVRGMAAGGIAAVLLAGAAGLHLARRAAIPERFQAHLEQARLALLDANYGEQCWIAAGGGREPLRPALSVSASSLERSVTEYRRALELDPTDAAARVEVLVASVVLDLADGELDDRRASAALARSCPMTMGFVEGWIEEGPRRLSSDSLADATAAERRAMGLFFFLNGDPRSCQDAWSGLDLASRPDPLIDAALGMVLLATGSPERAYPRLLRAAEEFPDVGFIAADVADVAIACGDLDVAERFLERSRAGALPVADYTWRRLQGDLSWARGRPEEALAHYEAVPVAASYPMAFLRAAQAREALGDPGGAMLAYLDLIAVAPRVPAVQTALAQAVRHWWSSLPESDKDQLAYAYFETTGGCDLPWLLLGSLAGAGGRMSAGAAILRPLPPSPLVPRESAALPRPDASASFHGNVLQRLEQRQRYAMSTNEEPVLVPLSPGVLLGILPDVGRFQRARSLVTLREAITGLAAAVFLLVLPTGAAQDCVVKSEQKISELVGGFGGNLDPSDRFAAVAHIGDLDVDGIPDLAVGAQFDDDGGTDQGAVWILFLNADGTVKSEQKISETAGSFGGVLDPTDWFGSIAPLGDLDGDGSCDLAVGAVKDDDGGSDHGAMWILFLNPDGTVKSEQKISDTEGGFGGALGFYDSFGRGGAALGDLDGDGTSDLAVSASYDDDGGTNQGAVWILFLNADGTVKAEQKISETTGGFGGDLDPNDQFSIQMASMNDLDGDAICDLAVGANLDDDGGTDQGAVWILFLNADGTVKAEQKISEIAGGFMGALAPGDSFGNSVASLGDIDGDGITDLAVGALFSDDGGSSQGALWILTLNADGTVKSEQKISETTGGFGGLLDPADSFAFCLAAPGDLDGDGVTDLAVGAWGDDDGGADQGAVWILFLNEVDTTPPTISYPPIVTAFDPKGSPPGEVVFFTVTASDECDPAPSVVCVPPSGSVFPRGTTLVTCTATDSSGNQTVRTFPVVVLAKVQRDSPKATD